MAWATSDTITANVLELSTTTRLYDYHATANSLHDAYVPSPLCLLLRDTMEARQLSGLCCTFVVPSVATLIVYIRHHRLNQRF
eukprot:910950-Pleurochrysis_carterae.AAC.11